MTLQGSRSSEQEEVLQEIRVSNEAKNIEKRSPEK